MGYEYSTFWLVVYGCIDTPNWKLLLIRAWTSNKDPVYPARWYFEYLYESKTLPGHIRIDKRLETTIMAAMQAFSWLWFTGLFHLFKGFLRRRLYFLTIRVFLLKLSSSLLALKAIWKPSSAKALSWISKIASLLIDHSLFSVFNFSIKTFTELFFLFQISFPSLIMSITNKLLAMKNFFSIALFSKLLAFFIGGGNVHDSEALSLFLIDARIVKRVNIKFKLGNWSKRVHEGPCSEANTSQFRFSLKCWVQACLIFYSNISS